MIRDSAYSVKSICVDAVIACVLAALSGGFVIASVVLSFLYDGKGPAAVGLLGVGSILLSLTGIVFTVSAWKSVDGGMMMKRVAGICNAIPLLIGIVLYVIGWV